MIVRRLRARISCVLPLRGASGGRSHAREGRGPARMRGGTRLERGELRILLVGHARGELGEAGLRHVGEGLSRGGRVLGVASRASCLLENRQGLAGRSDGRMVGSADES